MTHTLSSGTHRPALWRPTGTIAAFGDSTLTGLGCSDYVGPPIGGLYHSTEFGWVSLCIHDWPDTNWRVAAYNSASIKNFQPGARYGETIMSLLDTEQPDRVIVSMGGNDIVSNIDPITSAAALGQVFHTIRSVAGPATNIIFLSVWEFGFKRRTHPFAFPHGAYRDAWRVEADLADVETIDLAEFFHHADEKPGSGMFNQNEGGIEGCNLHLTNAGNVHLRYVMERELLPLLPWTRSIVG